MSETTPCPRALAKALTQHRTPSNPRALFEMAVTLIPFAVFWTAALVCAQRGWWAGLLFTVPAAGFLTRIFLIQHDCGHGAFFPSKAANDWTGRVLGVVTLTPYAYWRQTHAIHHATSGHLDRRIAGGIDTFTVEEYRAMTPARRWLYRTYRHPITQFAFGPAFVFFVQHRVPVDLMRAGWRPWASAMATNLAVAALFFALGSWLGWGAFLLVHLLTVAMAASLGVWLFYVQHQFEETHWSRQGRWQRDEAALHGSSYYDLPAPLRWLTANIGVHHVHHVDSRVPFYRLGEVLKEQPELKTIGRLTIAESFRCVKLALWDERRERMVSFREAT
ncbi:MAG: fatty acid desaturase [Proteobacteria bacterium]|nr:fatty acid desaturase [Pseudomonadota bacterium]